MTPVLKFLKRKAEEWFGKFYEGPEPPQRLREIAVAYANIHPRSTRAEWLEFAAAHAEEAYRCGWTRGFEHAERDPEPRDFTPEQLMDQVDHDWRWASPDVNLVDPLGIVQGEPLPDNILTQQFLDNLSPTRRGEP